MARRDLRPFSLLVEGFDNDVILRLRQVLQVRAQDLVELVDVAPFRARRRIVLVLIITRKDPVELTVGDFAAANDGLRQTPRFLDADSCTALTSCFRSQPIILCSAPLQRELRQCIANDRRQCRPAFRRRWRCNQGTNRGEGVIPRSAVTP